jgi:hypothetical protein
MELAVWRRVIVVAMSRIARMSGGPGQIFSAVTHDSCRTLLAASAAGAVRQMFQDVWTFADMSFGLGGLIVGVGTIAGAHWARMSGIVLCLLAAASNLLWFSDQFDKSCRA